MLVDMEISYPRTQVLFSIYYIDIRQIKSVVKRNKAKTLLNEHDKLGLRYTNKTYELVLGNRGKTWSSPPLTFIDVHTKKSGLGISSIWFCLFWLNLTTQSWPSFSFFLNKVVQSCTNFSPGLSSETVSVMLVAWDGQIKRPSTWQRDKRWDMNQKRQANHNRSEIRMIGETDISLELFVIDLWLHKNSGSVRNMEADEKRNCPWLSIWLDGLRFF